MQQLAMTAQSLKLIDSKYPAVYDATAGNDGAEPEGYGY
jgi:hypothetical protein